MFYWYEQQSLLALTFPHAKTVTFLEKKLFPLKAIFVVHLFPDFGGEKCSHNSPKIVENSGKERNGQNGSVSWI